MIAQYPIVLIIVKSLGLISMMASSFIIRHILKRLKGKQQASSVASMVLKITLTQSIMLCLSCGDFISSFFVPFLSTWMVPRDIDLVWASGNVQTCTAQGFISVMFFGLSVYSNATLAVSHCLVVMYNWKDNKKQRRRIAFTLTPFMCALVLSVIPLIWQNYNYNGGFYCDISASPIGCNTWDPDIECTRGANSLKVLLYAQLIPFMIAFLIIISAVSLLCHTVYKQEKRMDSYSVGSNQQPSRKLTSETAYQGIWYIAAFGITWIPWYCYAFDEITGGGVHDSLDYLHIFTKPLQGLFNSLVYFRPKYLSARARHRTETRFESLCRVLDMPVPRCYSQRERMAQQQDEKQIVEENPATDEIEAHKADDHPNELRTVGDCESGLVKISTLTTGTFENEHVMLSSFHSTSAPNSQAAPA